MHIPDGYLSPATCGVLGVAMVPVWARAGSQVRKVVKSQYVPLVALGAAYCFIVMMFNVPIPDGTTAHAVGAVLIAVLLGPWAAVIAVSVALLIQALFFGDGGVLAFGANAFNMAFVMPFVGYGVYLALTRKVGLTAPRRHSGLGSADTSDSMPPRCARPSSSACSRRSSTALTARRCMRRSGCPRRSRRWRSHTSPSPASSKAC